MPKSKALRRALAQRLLNRNTGYGWMAICKTIFDMNEREVAEVPESGEFYLLLTYGHEYNLSEFKIGKQPKMVWSSKTEEEYA